MNKKINLTKGKSEMYGLDPSMPKISLFKMGDIVAGNNPRQMFDRARLSELAESIKKHGVLSPILLEPNPDGGYCIIAGERRWRANKLAGKKEIIGILKTDGNAAEIAMIENVQREDLTPVEEATGYKNLMNDRKYSLRDLVAVVGKSKSSIGNSLSILKLPESFLVELDDYPHITKSQLIEIAKEKDEKKQKAVWVAAKQGRMTVRDTKAQAKGKRHESTMTPTERALLATDGAVARLEKSGALETTSVEQLKKIRSRISKLINTNTT